MDFAGAPEESRARINDWVAEETGDKVRNLLQPGSIDPSTRLVLTTPSISTPHGTGPSTGDRRRCTRSIWREAAVWTFP